MLAGVASDISQQVLRTDVAGMPLEWIDYREAVRLYHSNQVAYDCGTLLYTVFGGYSSVDGKRSKIDVNSIIATHGTSHSLARNRDKYVPPLNNRTLFKRDAGVMTTSATCWPSALRGCSASTAWSPARTERSRRRCCATCATR